MAVIINTAMEGVVCAAYDVFWRVKSVVILSKILLTSALKWVTWMHLMLFVVTQCSLYKLPRRKIDKSWTKVIQKVLLITFDYQLRLSHGQIVSHLTGCTQLIAATLEVDSSTNG